MNNFKSFRGENAFTFPVESGLYFLTGENKVENKLGSNGAGKSTLLDAIHWCLFGHSLRGLKAGDVVTWGERSCTVKVHLHCGHITRRQSPNSLELDGRVVTQEELEKHIGLNPDSFVHSVMLPQFGQSFFELKPADKLSLFSQIMKLDFWLDKSQQAADATRGLESRITKATNDIQLTTELLASVKADIEEFSTASKAFESEREKASTEIEDEIEEAETNVGQLLSRIEKAGTALKQLEKRRPELVKDLTHIEKIKNNHINQRDKLSNEVAVLKSRLGTIDETIEHLSGLKGACPTCKQVVNPQYLKSVIHSQHAKLQQEDALLKSVSIQLSDSNRFVAKATNDAVQVTTNLVDLNKQCSTQMTNLVAMETLFDSSTKEINKLKKRLQEKLNETNPYTERVKERQIKKDNLNNKLLLSKDSLQKLNAEHTATSYWVQGFKRVRLFIIEETLRALELEVNNALASLGLVDWQVEFDVERENKSGGVTKGFVVFIRCPSNPEPVRWESWSGGETQRLQLAGDFGLANLIMLQAGLTNTIEFYDEPSNHLSDEGLVDLAETLHQRASEDGKRIILVDHRMPDFGDFAGVITVTKDEEGSTIE
jgi:DNA repair exonuclease SbcCD ATPase subunit